MKGNRRKAPDVDTWKEFQTDRLPEDRFDDWFLNGKPPAGLAVITGFADLELFEFENRETADAFREAAKGTPVELLLRRVTSGYLEESPKGGWHLLWRCPAVGRSVVLAAEEPPEVGKPAPVLIETRGKPGLAIVAPSSAKVHESAKRGWRLVNGGPETIAEITAEEREAFFELARRFDLRPPPTPPFPSKWSNDPWPDRSHPGVAWAEESEETIEGMLEEAGWTFSHEEGEVSYWTRPGKESGVSATVGHARDIWGNPALYVFTTSTGFEGGRSYDKFGVYASLKHGGDFSTAAAELREDGYGDEEWSPDTGEISEREIEIAARKILLQRRGRERADAVDAASIEFPESRLTLREELEIEEEDADYTIDELLPIGGNVLLAARYKAGKTTLDLNVVRSLADGEAFLGVYGTRELTGRVAYWNYELTERQCRKWLREMEIANLDRASVLHLRGYRLPLDLPGVEDWAVEWLEEREVEFWIVDPFSRAYSGEENSNSEVGRFLEALDVVKQRAGVRDLILTTHMGREKFEEGEERARGATRIDDWADVRWTLNLVKGQRFFAANGRDVDVPERELRADGRLLTIGQATRHDARKEAAIKAAVNAVRSTPGIGKAALMKAMKGHAESAAEAIEEAVKRGKIRMEEKGQKQAHYLVEES